MLTSDFNIIPLRKNEKRPLVSWEKYQKELFPKEHLKEYPHCNYGVVCGEISKKLVVIDFDVDKNNKNDLKTIYSNIISQNPLLEKTFVVKTQSGGIHFYFRLVNSMDIYLKLERKNNIKSLIKGINHIEIQGEGKYVVCPPSSINENKYEIYKDNDVQYLNDNEFIELINSISPYFEDKINKLRKPLKALAEGKIRIKKYASEKNFSEHLYWNSFILECIAHKWNDPETAYEIGIVYIAKKEKIPLNKDNIGVIDLGVRNLITMVNNIGLKPIVVKGGIGKSINQFYNKERVRLMSNKDKQNIKYWTKRLKNLDLKRNNKMNDYFHKISKMAI